MTKDRAAVKDHVRRSHEERPIARGPKFLFVEVGATQNRNTGPPRHTLGKGGRPILTTAAVLPKYRRIPNPKHASKYGNAPYGRKKK